MEDKPQKKKQNPDVARMKAAIVKAETNRLYGEKERAELEKRQTPSTFYMGRGENGYSLVKTKKGLQELETVGNIQPSMGMAGRGGLAFDPGTVSRDDNRRSYSSVLPLKIVVSWNIDGRTKFYIGGHIKTPILALDIPTPSTVLYAILTNIGKGKNDWILQVRAGFNSNPEHYTRYGASPDKNWDLIGGQPLIPGGGGYWYAQSPPSGIPPTFTREEEGLDVGDWYPPDLEYDQDTSDWILDGPGSDTAYLLDTWTGWPAGSIFSGTNTYTSRRDELVDNSARPYIYYDGQGMSYYSGVYSVTTTTRTRTISTQAFAYWAFEGSSTTISGSYNFYAQTVREITSPREVTIPDTDETTTNGNASFSLAYPIAPGITKPYTSSGFYSQNTDPPGNGFENASEISFIHYFSGNSLYLKTDFAIPWVTLGIFDQTGGFNYSSFRETTGIGGPPPEYVTRKMFWRSPDGTEREIALDPAPGITIQSYKASGEIFTFYDAKLEPSTTDQSVIFQTNKTTWKFTTAVGSPTQPITFTKTEKIIQVYPIPKPATATQERVWEWKGYDF